MVSFTHEQNIICCQTKLDDIAYEQTIICMQLFACHVVDCRPMKRKKNLHRMIICVAFAEHHLSLYSPVPFREVYSTVHQHFYRTRHL